VNSHASVVEEWWLSPCLSVPIRSFLPDAGIAQTAFPSCLEGCSVPLPCLPLPCLRWRRRHPGQLGIGQALAHDTIADPREAPGIIIAPVVNAERFLIQIAEQVERLDADVGPTERPLEEAPEILDSVCMDDPIHILFGVVNDAVHVVGRQIGVGLECIDINGRARLNMLADFGSQGFASSIGDHLSTDSAMSIGTVPAQKSHHGGLPRATGAGDLPLFDGLVHEPSLAAKEGFVHFGLAVDHPGGFFLHGRSNPVEHEPRGFLSDADSSVDFVGADAIPIVGNHPDRGQPLIETDGAVLKDRPDFDRELLAGMLVLAFPNPPRGDEADFVAAAGGAGNPIGPPKLNHEIKANLGIGEVADGFE
jgi:hypothetical protein